MIFRPDGRRIAQRARDYRHTFVRGIEVARGGEDTARNAAGRPNTTRHRTERNRFLVTIKHVPLSELNPAFQVHRRNLPLLKSGFALTPSDIVR
jgi:hypothetical protein